MSITDIRQTEITTALAEQIWQGLDPGDGKEKSLPTMLLYDESGLKLFEKITYLEEYYLTNAEIELLKENAIQIVNLIKSGSKIVELGSGNLRKILILLDAIEHAGKDVDYFALDISRNELIRTLSSIPARQFKHVRLHGLLGTYDDGLHWLKKEGNRSAPFVVMTMGSSIGNVTRQEAAKFLRSYAEALRPGDLVVVGLDGCQSSEKIYRAYNDREGVTHEFIWNGLGHASRVLGFDAFKRKEWEISSKYDTKNGCHVASYKALVPVDIGGIHIAAGTPVQVETSFKFNDAEVQQLFRDGGLRRLCRFLHTATSYSVNVLVLDSGPNTASRHANHVENEVDGGPAPSRVTAPNGAPVLASLQPLRHYANMVTLCLLDEDFFREALPNLRYEPVFYAGHISGFFIIKISEALGDLANGDELEELVKIALEKFARGKDPDTADKQTKHTYTEKPQDGWGNRQWVHDFVQKVRQYIDKHIDGWLKDGPPTVKHALWLGFEHEMMHVETSFYQMPHIKHLPLFAKPKPMPDFLMIAKQAYQQQVSNDWVPVSARKLIVGAPRTDNPDGPFFWDNEMPQRHLFVPAFCAQARGISIGDYAHYLYENGISPLPKSWTSEPNPPESTKAVNGQIQEQLGLQQNQLGTQLPAGYLEGKYVKTVFGTQPLAFMLSHPFMGSYEEVEAYAKFIGGRIPTREEEESIYAQAEENRAMDAYNYQAAMVSGVNGHLSNQGVEETPPLDRCCDGKDGGFAPCPSGGNYADLAGCNIGFRHFHTTPITHLGDRLCGRCDNGGTWMWTSSVFKGYPFFEPMKSYPEYSKDFFEGKHNIALGGSWATHPQIAGRKSFVNFFQRSYEYAWIGARVVKDL